METSRVLGNALRPERSRGRGSKLPSPLLGEVGPKGLMRGFAALEDSGKTFQLKDHQEHKEHKEKEETPNLLNPFARSALDYESRFARKFESPPLRDLRALGDLCVEMFFLTDTPTSKGGATPHPSASPPPSPTRGEGKFGGRTRA